MVADMGSIELLSLVMIVKNESFSIQRTLDSVRGVVDRFTIVDTGSTDGTLDIIRAALADGWKGELIEAPFVDFSTTRNLALDAADDKSVFALMLSGDETLEGGAALRSFCEEHRDHPDGAYHVQIHFAASRFDSSRLTRCQGAGWRYRGVVHEVVMGPQGEVTRLRVPDTFVFHDTSRRTHASMKATWEQHLRLLKAEHQRAPNDTRTTFYLAQTQECLGQHAKALDNYRLRVSQGGWAEEVYEAKFRIGRVLDLLRRPWPEVQQAYLDAFAHSPHRAEPLFEIASHYHRQDDHALCVLFASQAASIPYPRQSTLFVDQDVYTWKCHDLIAIHCFYMGPEHKVFGKVSARLALSHRPHDARLKANLDFYDPPKPPYRAEVADEAIGKEPSADAAQ